MSVAVANSAAALTGKTLVLAESDVTITGQMTFDNDPGAPFDVTASSAVVTNLDADKLDGQEGTYYLARANHTGTNAADSVSGVSIAAISANRIPFAASSSSLTNSSNLTFDGTTLSIGQGQLAFPATQNASSGANTLDDYEEGTWTPADGSGASLSLTTVEAYYVKIGQMVTIGATFTYPSTANTSAAVISGLPFTVQNSTNDIWSGPSISTSASNVMWRATKNATTIKPYGMSNNTQFQNNNLSTVLFTLTLTYRATA